MEKIVKLADGPTDLQSIGVAYKEKILHSDLEDLTSLVVTCRQEGKRFIQPDYYQIFLDPTARITPEKHDPRRDRKTDG
jgi:hypothetical protein